MLIGLRVRLFSVIARMAPEVLTCLLGWEFGFRRPFGGYNIIKGPNEPPESSGLSSRPRCTLPHPPNGLPFHFVLLRAALSLRTLRTLLVQLVSLHQSLRNPEFAEASPRLQPYRICLEVRLPLYCKFCTAALTHSHVLGAWTS